MAFKHGKSAQVFIGTNELSAFLDTADQSTDVDTAETSVFGVGWKTFLAGLIGSSLSISGSYDPTVTTGPAALMETAIANGTAWPWKYFPGGSVTGQRSHSFNALITNYSESAPVSDKVSWSGAVLASGTVTSSTL